jgi:hypothetical protein
VHEIIFSLYNKLNLAYVVDILYEASMKVECPVGDLKIVCHLFHKVSVQQKLYAMRNMENMKE